MSEVPLYEIPAPLTMVQGRCALEGMVNGLGPIRNIRAFRNKRGLPSLHVQIEPENLMRFGSRGLALRNQCSRFSLKGLRFTIYSLRSSWVICGVVDLLRTRAWQLAIHKLSAQAQRWV